MYKRWLIPGEVWIETSTGRKYKVLRVHHGRHVRLLCLQYNYTFQLDTERYFWEKYHTLDNRKET